MISLPCNISTGRTTTTNSGNTVYKWSPTTGQAFINGTGQGVPFHHKIFLTVWDGGGVDTYDFSNYTTNAVIDLAPGGWSTPSRAQRADLDLYHPNTIFARGCIANAQVLQGDLHGYIENAIGGSGNDTMSGNGIGNSLTGGLGNDVLKGLAGIDGLFGGAGGDSLNGGDGGDGLGGGKGNDTLTGGNNNDYLDGGQGADRLNGGNGNDVLIGGANNDLLAGGAGADTFDFNAIGDSGIAAGTSDVIADFATGIDKIDFSDIDANTAVGGNQQFTFIGTHDFYEAGQVRVEDSGGVTHLYINTDADTAAEMAISFSGFKIVLAGDFIFV
jgi:serralysin